MPFHSPYLSILSESDDPSVPVCPQTPFGPVSLTWSEQAYSNPLSYVNGWRGCCFYKNPINSSSLIKKIPYMTFVPSLV